MFLFVINYQEGVFMICLNSENRLIKNTIMLALFSIILILPVKAADLQNGISLLSKSSATILENDLVSTEYISSFNLTGEEKEITLIFSNIIDDLSSIARMKTRSFDDKSGRLPLELGCCGASAVQKYSLEINGVSIPFKGMSFSESGVAWSSNCDLITFKAGKGIVKVKRSVILKPYIEGFQGSIDFGIGDRVGTGALIRENELYKIDGYRAFARIETVSEFSIRDSGIISIKIDDGNDLRARTSVSGRVRDAGVGSWFLKDDAKITVRWKSLTDKALGVSSFSREGLIRGVGPSIEEMDVTSFDRKFSDAVIADLKNDVGYRLLYFALSEPVKSSYKKETLELLRNTIMAYYGYTFSRKEYSQFFPQFFWYMPEKGNSYEKNIPDAMKGRIELIKQLEKKYQ
jgi:hypothetical protein